MDSKKCLLMFKKSLDARDLRYQCRSTVGIDQWEYEKTAVGKGSLESEKLHGIQASASEISV